jgi:deoxyribonuclease V
MEAVAHSMVACTDAHYYSQEAIAACVLFREWHDHQVAGEIVEHLSRVEPYQPGMFYRRELPCLLKVLSRVRHSLEAVLVDGYVWLGPGEAPGLGAHLYQALQEKVPVIGVAKSRFARSACSIEVFRGRSRRPLYVSSVGIDSREAGEKIGMMHGSFRIPTLLKRVDQLCRAG